MKHVAEVQKFFKGFQIEIFARNEDEVQPSVLREQVNKLSSRIKIPKSSAENLDIKHVGANYKRIVPANEISTKEREAFWEKQRQEEMAVAKAEKEAKKKEAIKIERSEVNNNERPAPSSNSSHQVKKERIDEAKSVISTHSITNARAFFEQNTATSQISSSNRTPPSKIIDSTRNSNVAAIKANLLEAKSSPPPTTTTQNDSGNVNNSTAITNGNGFHSQEVNSHNNNEDIDDYAEKDIEEGRSAHAQSDESGSDEYYQSPPPSATSAAPLQPQSALQDTYQYYARELDNIEEEPRKHIVVLLFSDDSN